MLNSTVTLIVAIVITLHVSCLVILCVLLLIISVIDLIVLKLFYPLLLFSGLYCPHISFLLPSSLISSPLLSS